MKRFCIVALVALLLGVGVARAQTLPAAAPAASAPVAPSDLPRTYWLIVTGLSGEDEIGTKYNQWSARIADAARSRFNATRAVRLSESGTGGATATSTKANIEAQITQIAADARRNDAVFIILIGHGSAADGTARIALPGPDLTATDLAALLSIVEARVTVLNTASASGAWIAPLAAKGRVVVTATKSAVEQNETTFAEYFATALSSDAADTDKDNRVSVLEAFDFAKRETERAYTADKKMLTEHAQIDGDGDGKSVASATSDSPDGAVASLTFFGASAASSASAAPQTPELRALYAQKAQLEQRLAQLRSHKAETSDAEYQKQLEALLLEIATNGQTIRKLEGIK